MAMPEKIESFTLTEQHIKLLRAMCVGWQDAETGAPEIDPKRPYGNSDVARDVAEIIGGSIQERHELLALHRETEIALQVVLSTGSFVPGKYVRYAPLGDWKRVVGA